MTLSSFALSHQGYYRSHNEDAYLEQTEQGLFVIADGIGSLANGEWASQILVQPFIVGARNAYFADRVYWVKRELMKRHQHLFYTESDISCGATIVALLIHAGQAMVLWAGDARAYCYHKNTGELLQLTEDHVDGRAVTRAVGVERDLALDEKMLNVTGDEVFLLCSDGLNKGISSAEIKWILAQHISLSSSCKKLIDSSLARGCQDNITVLRVDV